MRTEQLTGTKPLRQLEEDYDRLERAIRILEPLAENLHDNDILDEIRLSAQILGEVIIHEYRSKGLIV